jgi:NAD-dependent deacetylase
LPQSAWRTTSASELWAREIARKSWNVSLDDEIISVVTSPTAGLDEIRDWIFRARRVVVLTGAGISTDSGIPDFRGPQGTWTKDPKAERMATLDAYMSSSEVRVRAWIARLEHPAWRAAPNEAHRALVRMEAAGRMDTLITQNIDGLHQLAGSSPERVIEIHGSMREVMCMSCDHRGPMQEALERVRAGDPDPSCLSCGGILKSATISFGQPLDAGDLRRAERAAAGCDVFVAAGTSLVVFPVAYLPQVALARGARLVVLNGEPTPYDHRAHAVVREPLGRSLPALARSVDVEPMRTTGPVSAQRDHPGG